MPRTLSCLEPCCINLQARVEPRNPAYDWRRSPQLEAGGPRRAALLLAVDAHMAAPESREALLRMAQLVGGRGGGGGGPWVGSRWEDGGWVAMGVEREVGG